jgi:large subunit ribosomal protein L2
LVGKYVHNKKLFNVGEILKIKDIPEGSKVFNIEKSKYKGGQLIRAAGCSGIIIKHLSNNTSVIKLPSKINITVASDCIATIGTAGNALHINRIDGKAGVIR